MDSQQARINFMIHVAKAYASASSEVKSDIDEMAQIAIDPKSDEQELYGAVHTLLELLWPEGISYLTLLPE